MGEVLVSVFLLELGSVLISVFLLELASGLLVSSLVMGWPPIVLVDSVGPRVASQIVLFPPFFVVEVL